MMRQVTTFVAMAATVFLNLAPAATVLATASQAQAQTPERARVRAPDAAARCASMASFSGETRGDPAIRARLTQIPDAPTEILTAVIVPATEHIPEYCLVTGYVAPTVGFEVKLPTTTWNGKFMMQGCGGACGVFFSPQQEDGLQKGFATAATDLGHKGHAGSWLFTYANLQGLIDFSFRATHVTALAAKEIIAIYYQAPPRLSYFNGCSTGGNMGLMEAQRFPNDFDGILAGAPPPGGNHQSLQSWSALANMGPDGRPILYADRLKIAARAAMESCDKLDGLKDGLLQDPQKCRWDPAAIVCAPGQATDACLTAAEANVIRKIYDGPRDSKGRSLGFGMQRGSEWNWVPGFIGVRPQLGAETPNLATALNGPQFPRPGLGSFYPAVPANAQKPYDYDTDPQRGALMGSIRAVGNPDLREFKAHGGKLMIYHGWDDNEISTLDTVDYYQMVTRTMGGEAATKEFARLYLPPNMGHCRHGPGGGAIDWLAYLDAWVETGKAPDAIVAHHLTKDQNYLGVPRLYYPLDKALYDRTRPVYAYPDTAQWTGKGDAALAENWRKASRGK